MIFFNDHSPVVYHQLLLSSFGWSLILLSSFCIFVTKIMILMLSHLYPLNISITNWWLFGWSFFPFQPRDFQAISVNNIDKSRHAYLSSGQYKLHLGFPFSTRLVTITMRTHPTCQHIRQKSLIVNLFGPGQNTNARWFETVWNRRIQFIDLNLFPMSSGVN